MHLAFLRRHYVVVPVSAIERGELPLRAAAITFDDGYASVYTHAWPLLRELGMPATVYLVTSAVDNVSLVWANELNWFLKRMPGEALARSRERLALPPNATAAEVVEVARARYDHAQIEGLLAELRSTAGISGQTLASRARLYMTWAQVREMASAGISFGNHTASHPNMTRLSDEEKLMEITEGRDAIVDQLGECTSFAYPFGDRDVATQRVAVAAGHQSIMEVGGGNERPHPLRMGRVPVHAHRPADLFAELEIIAPFVAGAKSVRALLAWR
jgi:peptidoglycan/xylan/chitin deacetylase (PgdA/CDA1 family)